MAEFNKEKYKNLSTIKENIEKGVDPFERNLRLEKVNIDDTYPDYIKNNLDKFKNWILK